MPTYNITQAAGPTNTSATAKPRGVRLKCDPVANSWFDHFEIRRYDTSSDASSDTNPTILYEGVNTNVLDSDELTSGEDYFYKWFWIDQYGNRSAAGTTRSATYRGVSTADIEAKAVTPSSFLVNPAGNLIADYELTDVGQWSFREYAYFSGGTFPTGENDAIALPGGQVVQSVNPTEDGRGSSDFKFTAEVSESQNALLIANGVLSPVDPGERYVVSCIVEQVTTSPGVLYAHLAYLEVHFWRMGSGGDLEFVSSESVDQQGDFSSSDRRTLYAVVQSAPDDASYMSLYVRIRPSSGSAYKIKFIFASPSIRHIPRQSLFSKMLTYKLATAVSFGSSASGQQIAKIELPEITGEPDYFSNCLIHLSFKHNSGSAKTMDVLVRMFGPAGVSSPVDLGYIPSVTLQNGNTFGYTFVALAAVRLGAFPPGDGGDPWYVEARLVGADSGNSVRDVNMALDLRDGA